MGEVDEKKSEKPEISEAQQQAEDKGTKPQTDGSSSDESNSSSDEKETKGAENINTEVEKSIKPDKKAEGAEKEKKDPKGSRIMRIENRKYNQNSTKSDSSDSDTDSDEKTDPSSTMKETVSQKPSKTVDMKQHLSSTVLHGHSKKRSPVVPDGISPIQASKAKSKAQAPLKLFDKVFRN